MRPLSVGSLFSGIGGLDLGLEWAGWRTVWQCEVDPYARRVLRRHWPDIPCYGDVRTLDKDVERVELLVGGFPCQPVSVAGRGLAQDDPRWLWPEFHRVIDLLRPPFVLLENVPGLVNRGMGDVLGSLAESGYDATWDCVPAAAVGAPHLRYRWFCVAADADRVVLRDEQGRGGREVGEGPPEPGHDGAARPLADAAGPGRERPCREPGESRRGRPSHGCGEGVGTMADADRPGLEGEWPRDLGRIWGARSSGSARSAHWHVEPDVGRVAHGVPARVDRLRALGNGVVPQVAQSIGATLKAYRDGVLMGPRKEAV